MSWQNDLKARFPEVMARGSRPDVGDGWRELVERAVERIAAVGGSVRIVQIKEKFGGLRIYYTTEGISDAALRQIEHAIELAEARALCTCDDCGKEGRLYDYRGLRLVRCEQHKRGKAVPRYGLSAVTKLVGEDTVTKCYRYDRERDELVEVECPPDIKLTAPDRFEFPGGKAKKDL
jgi:hypothetical protein